MDEKLCLVLPQLLSMRSPKGRPPWAGYKQLKSLRDATIHFKTKDHYVRGPIDETSVFYRFLDVNPLDYAAAAIRVMRHFTPAQTAAWLDAANKRLRAPRA